MGAFWVLARLARLLKRHGFNAALVAATVAIMWIYVQSWRLDVPVWSVTKHCVSSYKDIRGAYFTPRAGIDPEPYKTYRRRFQMEYDLEMAASEFDFEAHFEALDAKTKDAPAPLALGDSIEDFMEDALATFQTLGLQFDHPERAITNAGKTVIWETVFKDDPYETLTEQALNGLMDFHDYFVRDLSLKHRLLLRALPADMPSFYKDTGYVYLGGGQYTWLSLLSIQGLRERGARMPVEVMIPSKAEYDEALCAELVLLNAKCKVFPSLGVKVKGYQLKPLAILFSSFQRAFYVDSDVVPTTNPDSYFTSQLFARYGLITWPDFWRRTTSPKLYGALGITVGGAPQRFLNDLYTPSKYSQRRATVSNFHDLRGALPEWTTEAGLLLINKKTHFNVVLLALYYNLNGPKGYYPMLSQGGAGEGDKDTWALAAHVLKRPWWQVSTQPRKMYGTWVKDRNWIVDSAIVQVGLLDDYEGLLGLVWGQDVWRREMVAHVGEDQFAYNYGYAMGNEAWNYASVLGATLGRGNYGLGSEEGVWEPLAQPASPVQCVKRPPDAFYHIHSPKLDPWEYVLTGKFTDKEGNQMRNFGTDAWIELGFDIELWVWERVRDNLCGNGPLTEAVRQLSYFKDRDPDTVCGPLLDEHIEWLRKEGEPRLAKVGQPLHGWKLRGSTREMVEARIHKAREDNQ